MSKAKRGWELPISEHELSRMTKDLDEAHRETIPTMYAAAADLSEELRTHAGSEEPDAAEGRRIDATRRRFLFGAGGAAAALALAACSSTGKKAASAVSPSSSTSSSMSPGPSASGSSRYTGDLHFVALSAALENQGIGAYRAALSAARAGKLGKVPPAVAAFAAAAMSQHQDHVKAWNAVLKGAGKPAITGVPLSDQDQVTAALASVKDVAGVAKLALQLEDQAAQTYLLVSSNVTSAAGIATAASIAPVEAMHSAILHYVLGEYPIPDDFLPTDKAASPSLLTA